MSSLPPIDPSNIEEVFLINPNSNFIDPTLEELLSQTTDELLNVSHNCNDDINGVRAKQQKTLGSQSEGLKLKKISDTRKKRIAKCIGSDSEDGESDGETRKKKDHNAKERVRRMKLNASYLALRALLPTSPDHSRRSKKRLSAPTIVDRALHYIPELENELETLKSYKNNLLHSPSIAGEKRTKMKMKRIIDDGDDARQQGKDENQEHFADRVFVESISPDDAIIQMCYRSIDNTNENGLLGLIDVMERLELQEFMIKSCSSVCVACSDDHLNNNNNRICCHLHFQANRGPESKADGPCIKHVISQFQQQ